MSSATKKILLFFLSFFWVVGALGSFLSLISKGEYAIAIGLVVVIYSSVPKIREWVKFIISNE